MDYQTGEQTCLRLLTLYEAQADSDAWEQALDLFLHLPRQRQYDLQPEFVRVLAQMGRYEEARQWASAISPRTHAIQRESAFTHLVSAALQAKAWDEARTTIAMIPSPSQRVSAWIDYGRISQLYLTACAEARRLLELMPDQSDAKAQGYLHLIGTWIDLGRLDCATDLYLPAYQAIAAVADTITGAAQMDELERFIPYLPMIQSQIPNEIVEQHIMQLAQAGEFAEALRIADGAFPGRRQLELLRDLALATIRAGQLATALSIILRIPYLHFRVETLGALILALAEPSPDRDEVITGLIAQLRDSKKNFAREKLLLDLGMMLVQIRQLALAQQVLDLMDSMHPYHQKTVVACALSHASGNPKILLS
jgi:hypothetical protein